MRKDEKLLSIQNRKVIIRCCLCNKVLQDRPSRKNYKGYFCSNCYMASCINGHAGQVKEIVEKRITEEKQKLDISNHDGDSDINSSGVTTKPVTGKQLDSSESPRNI